MYMADGKAEPVSRFGSIGTYSGLQRALSSGFEKMHA